MTLLDVNALVALAWDSHVHHLAARDWFKQNSDQGWETCPITESGFVRVSSNPKVLPHPIGINSAIRVLTQFKDIGAHRFLEDDVSITQTDFPEVHGYRQVTDAHLLTIARRNETQLLTFDSAIATLTTSDEVVLLKS